MRHKAGDVLPGLVVDPPLEAGGKNCYIRVNTNKRYLAVSILGVQTAVRGLRFTAQQWAVHWVAGMRAV